MDPPNNVVLVKIDGPVWYTTYHHRNLLLKGKTNPSINQPTNGNLGHQWIHPWVHRASRRQSSSRSPMALSPGGPPQPGNAAPSAPSARLCPSRSGVAWVVSLLVEVLGNPQFIESDHDLVLKAMVLGTPNIKKSFKMVI